MPKWQKNFTPDSFMEIVKQNLSIKAHSLILVDIGLGFDDAIEQLEEAAEKHSVRLKSIVLCQALGTGKQRIIYDDFQEIKKIREGVLPYCFIIPSELHFMEKEVLERFREN